MGGVMRGIPPLPSAIQSLPRDARGYPIPYVAAWSSEREGPPATARLVTLGATSWYGVVIAQMDTPGKGVAQLGKIEASRQLRAHEFGLCNVCGRKVGRTLTYVGGGIARQTYTEAPLHRACAVWSLKVCPALLRGRAGTDALVVTEIPRGDVHYHGVFLNSEGDRQILPFHQGYVHMGWCLMGALAITDKESAVRRSATDYLAHCAGNTQGE